MPDLLREVRQPVGAHAQAARVVDRRRAALEPPRHQQRRADRRERHHQREDLDADELGAQPLRTRHALPRHCGCTSIPESRAPCHDLSQIPVTLPVTARRASAGVGAQSRDVPDHDVAAVDADEAGVGELVQDAREVLGREVEARRDDRLRRRQRHRVGRAGRSRPRRPAAAGSRSRAACRTAANTPRRRR